MKKTLSLIFAFVFAFGLLAVNVSAASIPEVISEEANLNKVCADSANIFNDINWNFESPTHNGEYYWNMVNTIDGMSSAYFYVMSVVDDKAHDGKRSLLLDGIGGWSNIIIPINVKKNTVYTFSMWVNASPGLGGKQNSIFKFGSLTGHKIDSIPAKSWGGDNGFPNYDGEWHHVGVTVNSLDNDQIALLIADGGGTMYFDELRFFETANPNGKAATSVANLAAVKAHYEAETNKTSKTSEGEKTTTTTKPTEIGGNTSDVTDTDSSKTSTTAENGTSEDSDKTTDGNATVNNTTSPKNNNKGNYTWIIIVLVVIALAGGGAALWFFKFRKKDETNINGE